MDWESIERDMSSHAQALAFERKLLPDKSLISSAVSLPVGGLSSSIGPLDDLGIRHLGQSQQSIAESKGDTKNTFDSHYSMPIPPPPSFLSPENMWKELQELRAFVQQQNKKMAVMERMFQSYNDILESSSTSHLALVERVDDLNVSLATSSNMHKESEKSRNEMATQLRALSSRLTALEASRLEDISHWISKEEFAHLVQSTYDSLTNVKESADRATLRSAQSHSLIESILIALSELRSQASNNSISNSSNSISNGNAASAADNDPMSTTTMSGTNASTIPPPPFRFDLLLSLPGDRQRDQVVRLLSDGLRAITSTAVNTSISEAMNTISSNVHDIVSTTQATHEQRLQSTIEKCEKSVHKIGTRIDTCTDALSQYETILAAVRKDQIGDRDHILSMKEALNSTELGLRTARSSVAGLEGVVEVLTSSIQQSRQSMSTQLEEVREELRRFEEKVAAGMPGVSHIQPSSSSSSSSSSPSVLAAGLNAVDDNTLRAAIKAAEGRIGDRVDKLEKVLVDVESSFGSLSASVAANASTLDELTARVGDGAASGFVGREGGKDGIKEGVHDGDADRKIKSLTSKVANLEQQLNNVAAKLSSSTSSSSSSTSMPSSSSTQPSPSNKRISDDITDLRTELTTLSNTQSKLADDYEAISLLHTQLSQRIELLSETDSSLQLSIEDIADKFSKLELSVEEIEKVRLVNLEDEIVGRGGANGNHFQRHINGFSNAWILCKKRL